jgi:hypothetical protein
LYQHKTEVRPQFGRGFFAGIDPKEQIEKYKEVSKNLKNMREAYVKIIKTNHKMKKMNQFY